MALSALYENANDDFFLAANQILMICTKAGKIFENSDISKKWEMVKLIFHNLKLDGKKFEYKLKTPFEGVLSANTTHNVGLLWDTFRTFIFEETEDINSLLANYCFI